MKILDQDGRSCLAYARAAASIAAAKSQSNSTTALNSGSASTVDSSSVTIKNLIDLLLSLGCPEVSWVPNNGGTIPRRRGSQTLPQFEKLPSSVI